MLKFNILIVILFRKCNKKRKIIKKKNTKNTKKINNLTIFEIKNKKICICKIYFLKNRKNLIKESNFIE